MPLSFAKTSLRANARSRWIASALEQALVVEVDHALKVGLGRRPGTYTFAGCAARGIEVDTVSESTMAPTIAP